MKYRLFFLFLALALLLSACTAPVNNKEEAMQEASRPVSSSGNAADTPSVQETEPANTDAPPDAPETSAAPVSVENAFFREGDYRDSVGNEYHYYYRIPAFTGDSEDAQRLNAGLYGEVMNLLQSDLECIDGEDSCSLFCLTADYEVYTNGNILSVVEVVHNDWGQTFYRVMNLNRYTQREADRAALLAYAGFDEASFLLRATEAAGNAFGDPASFSGELRSFAEEQYAKTISEDNFGSELMLFLDGEGRLCMITPIYSLAGADCYYHIVPIE